MMTNLASDPMTRHVRMSFIGRGVPEAERLKLASQGESIEKALRKQLAGVVAPEKLQQLTLGLDMRGTTTNEGVVNLIVGKPKSTYISQMEQIEIQNAFREAIGKYTEPNVALSKATLKCWISSSSGGRGPVYSLFFRSAPLNGTDVSRMSHREKWHILGEEVPIKIHLTIAGSRLEFLDECAHYPWLDSPVRYFDLIRGFLMERVRS